MKAFLHVTVDPQWPIGLVTYRSNESAARARVVRRNLDGRVGAYSLHDYAFIDTGVAVHETRDGGVVEFEILDVDDAVMVGLARDYARENGLEFPADLRAAAKVTA